MKTISLVWGESIVVRQALLDTIAEPLIVFSKNTLNSLNYPPFEGHPELRELTKKVILRQTGQDYDHVIITNGATGGVTIGLRALTAGYIFNGDPATVFYNTPYFSLYPAMVEAAGLEFFSQSPDVYLLDSPSNPLGIDRSRHESYGHKVLWDAVYHNKVYMPGPLLSPRHDVVAGSYSKLLGLNGIRLGWLATNDPVVYHNAKRLVAAEYCGVSEPSSQILLEILNQFKTIPTLWDQFENKARFKLDCNREEWSRLERYFGGEKVNANGMFFFGKMDQAAKDLFKRAEIMWSPGTNLGASEDFGRFNIGESNEIIKEVVKRVLKADKV